MTIFRGFDEAVVVDVETTGLDPETDRIVAVAMVRVHFEALQDNPQGLLGETMDVIVNPQCRIPVKASCVHGITDRHVANKGSFADSAHQLRGFISNRPIIAHNVSFDKNFLNAEFKRAGVKSLTRNKSYCTMLRFQDFNNGQLRGSNLDNVAEVMGVAGRMSGKHEAIEDANMTFEIAALFYMMDNGIRIPRG